MLGAVVQKLTSQRFCIRSDRSATSEPQLCCLFKLQSMSGPRFELGEIRLFTAYAFQIGMSLILKTPFKGVCACRSHTAPIPYR